MVPPTDVDNENLDLNLNIMFSGQTYAYAVSSNPQELNVFASEFPFGEQITWNLSVSDDDTTVFRNQECLRFQFNSNIMGQCGM